MAIGALLGSVSLLLLAMVVHLRAQAPAASPRPASQVVAKVSLGEVGLTAGAASATRFVYPPGISMAPHTHTGRTSIITIVKGQLTERRGDVVHVYKAGDVITVAEGATHANENAGPDDLVYVEVNITGTVPRPAPTPAK
jgi:quercetin dioxygenase-like cupin family protein